MSVLYVEGFETSADQPDVVGRGLLSATSPVTVAGIGVLPAPSRTGVAGTGLMLRGPYGTSTALPNSSGGVSDFGMLPINQSVYSLYQAGGFALGVNASFNSLNVLQIAPGCTQQIVYDGATNYWAVAYNGSAYVVCYSPDLKNWTVTATAPANMSVSSLIGVSGSGASATITVGPGLTGANSGYYSTNLGATWTAFGLAGNQSSFYPAVFPTPNSSTPFISCGWIQSTGYRVFTYASAAAAPVENTTTLVSGFTIAGVSINYLSSAVKNIGGYTLLIGRTNASGAYYPTASNATAIGFALTSSSLTTPANWTVSAYAQWIADFAYQNGSFYGAGYGGIYQYNIANGTWAQVLSTGTSSVYAIAGNGTLMVAVGQDPINPTQGAIWTSTNGTTWTKANRFIMSSVAVSSTNTFANVIWDGAKFILTGAFNNSFIATSVDGLAWNVVYVPEYTEATGTACASFLGVFSGQQSASNGIFTPWGTAAGNTCGVGIVAAAAASNLRTVTAATVTAGAFAASAQTASLQALSSAVGLTQPSTLCHYYELIFTAVPGTVNAFNVSWAIDNALVGTLGQYQMAAPTDTTGLAQLFFNLPRTGNFTQLDDIYLTNFTGPYHYTRLGIQRVYPMGPNSDVTDNFTTTISGATNSKTVNTTLSNSEGYVSSSATTAQDIYGSTNSVPSTGTTVNAVQVEGFMTALNGTPSGGAVGLQSNGVQKIGPVISTGVAPSRAILLQETDPNTNVPWTIAGLNAVDIVVAKTS